MYLPKAWGRYGTLTGVLLALAPAAFGQTFAPVASYNVGTNANPLGVAVADLNGDGKRDIVTCNNGSNLMGVLLNNGAGTFAAVATTSTGTGSQPYDVAAADVNADGKADILTANYGTSTVGALLGNGNGTFAGAVAYSTGSGSQPFGLAVADVNADGKLDLISANTYSSTVGVLLGVGNGTFQAITTYPVASPSSLALTDVNADGKLDIVSVSGNGSGLASVQLGNGNGTFGTATSYTAVSNTFTFTVMVGDVSGDGKPNIITANPGDYTVGVLRNNGNGTFAAATTFALGSISAPYGVAVADVSGDGKPDIVTTNVNTNTVSVLLNTSPFLAAQPAALAAELALYPNPATTTADFTANGLPADARSVEATLLGPLGQVVRRATVPTAQGNAQAGLPTAGLAAGLYLLRLTAHDAQRVLLGTLPTQRLEVR